MVSIEALKDNELIRWYVIDNGTPMYAQFKHTLLEFGVPKKNIKCELYGYLVDWLEDNNFEYFFSLAGISFKFEEDEFQFQMRWLTTW